MSNLWPSNTFTQNVEKNTPIALLREQANYLTEATGSFLVGDVKTRSAIENNSEITYSFIIKAPSLRNYSFELFTLHHLLTNWYPMAINFPFEQEIIGGKKPIFSGFDGSNDELYIQDKAFAIRNEAELAEALKTIFTHPKTVSALQILMAQAAA